MQATPPPTAPPGLSQETGMDIYPTPPVNRTSPPFGVLSGLYDRLQSEKKPEKRRKALASWLNHWREEVGKDLYPVLRLLLPQKDRERAVYGLKEKNLAKTYIKLIPLGMKDPDAIRLLNWKRPTERDKTAGDFPTVLYEVIAKRSSVIEGTLTIDEVNDILDDMCKDMGKQDIQSKLLQRLYNRTTPEEQRWIARIILKDMNIMVKETTVFAVFHPDAHDLFNTCSDLKKVAWELWDTSRRLGEEDKSVQLFRAFAPMLCKRPANRLEETVKHFLNNTFIIEEKLDGERMQLHKRGNEYFYCSRKGKDYTYLYGGHVGTGSLTPFIGQAFDSRVEEIILDGEMLVWDPVTERNLPFGTLKTAALDKARKEASPRPCFKVFDLLYLNGISLAKKSTKFRKRNMKACIKEIKGRIEYITDFEGKTTDDIRKRMGDVMEARGEGLIIKHPNAEYVLNARNNDWVKVKPEYMDNMGETVDVLVVGGNYGSGKRGGGVSTLICAVMDDRRPYEDDEQPKYSTFVRIGSGLTYADYVWIRQKNWKPFDRNEPPDWYQAAKKTAEDKGDVYLEPEDSFILKVKAAEITPSDQYHIGFTMRFPRAIGIREDLSVADCMTVSSIFDSMKTERKRKMENKDLTTKKKRKTVKKATVLPQYQGPSLKDTEVESDLFEGLTFMVASDPKSRTGEMDKTDLLRLIHVHGGKYVQVATGKTAILVVYGGSIVPYDIKLIMDKDTLDIIKPQWIYDCISVDDLIPLKKRYFFHATSARQDTEEYDADEDMDEELPANPPPNKPVEKTESEQGDSDRKDAIAADDPLADWFNVPELEHTTIMEDSETEDDDADSGDEGDNLGDWLQVKSEDAGEGIDEGGDAVMVEAEPAAVKMGETDQAMEYDQDKIFKHLVFYLDAPQNATKNQMQIKTKFADQISKSFVEVESLITANGGRIADLGDPKLTHVVLDKRDNSRRKELIRATSKPKARHLVVSEFIHACIEENTLLDEEAFMP